MRNYDCVTCRFCKKIIRRTKPQLLCAYGRYGNEPEGGYPIAWIKKCDKQTEYEYCPHCDSEIEVQLKETEYKVKCPNCDKTTFACSKCMANNPSGNCDWDEATNQCFRTRSK